MFELERSQSPRLWGGNELHPAQKLWAPPGITSDFTLPPPHAYTHHTSQPAFTGEILVPGEDRRYLQEVPSSRGSKRHLFLRTREFAKMLPDNDGVPPHNPLAHWLLAAREPVLCTSACHPCFKLCGFPGLSPLLGTATQPSSRHSLEMQKADALRVTFCRGVQDKCLSSLVLRGTTPRPAPRGSSEGPQWDWARCSPG